MSTFIALFRAVNLPGYNRVGASDLKALAEACGGTSPRTLLASGNLIFQSAARSSAAVEASLERALARRWGIATPVVVRSASEWQALIEANPFSAEARADPGHLLVMPLKGAPKREAVAALTAAIPGQERVKANGRELYLVYPDGVGRSKLTSALIERHLGVAGTARNWNTSLKLLAAAGTR